MEIRPDDAHVANRRQPDQDPLGFTATPPSLHRDVEINPFRTFAFSLVRFSILSSVIVIALLAVLATLWVVQGARPVLMAARHMVSAEDAWFAALNQSVPAIQELASRGAPGEDLEKVYFAYADAKLANKAERADVFLQVMQDQTIAVRALGHETDHIFQMIEPAAAARSEVTIAYQAWLRAVEEPSAKTAVMMGLVNLPHPRLATYATGPRPVQMMLSEP